MTKFKDSLKELGQFLHLLNMIIKGDKVTLDRNNGIQKPLVKILHKMAKKSLLPEPAEEYYTSPKGDENYIDPQHQGVTSYHPTSMQFINNIDLIQKKLQAENIYDAHFFGSNIFIKGEKVETLTDNYSYYILSSETDLVGLRDFFKLMYYAAKEPALIKNHMPKLVIIDNNNKYFSELLSAFTPIITSLKEKSHLGNLSLVTLNDKKKSNLKIIELIKAHQKKYSALPDLYKPKLNSQFNLQVNGDKTVIFLCSNNDRKVNEWNKVFQFLGINIRVFKADDLGWIVPEADEISKTLEGNAAEKLHNAVKIYEENKTEILKRLELSNIKEKNILFIADDRGFTWADPDIVKLLRSSPEFADIVNTFPAWFKGFPDVELAKIMNANGDSQKFFKICEKKIKNKGKEQRAVIDKTTALIYSPTDKRIFALRDYFNLHFKCKDNSFNNFDPGTNASYHVLYHPDYKSPIIHIPNFEAQYGSLGRIAEFLSHAFNMPRIKDQKREQDNENPAALKVLVLSNEPDADLEDLKIVLDGIKDEGMHFDIKPSHTAIDVMGFYRGDKNFANVEQNLSLKDYDALFYVKSKKSLPDVKEKIFEDYIFCSLFVARQIGAPEAKLPMYLIGDWDRETNAYQAMVVQGASKLGFSDYHIYSKMSLEGATQAISSYYQKYVIRPARSRNIQNNEPKQLTKVNSEKPAVTFFGTASIEQPKHVKLAYAGAFLAGLLTGQNISGFGRHASMGKFALAPDDLNQMGFPTYNGGVQSFLTETREGSPDVIRNVEKVVADNIYVRMYEMLASPLGAAVSNYGGAGTWQEDFFVMIVNLLSDSKNSPLNPRPSIIINFTFDKNDSDKKPFEFIYQEYGHLAERLNLHFIHDRKDVHKTLEKAFPNMLPPKEVFDSLMRVTTVTAQYDHRKTIGTTHRLAREFHNSKGKKIAVTEVKYPDKEHVAPHLQNIMKGTIKIPQYYDKARA